MIGNKYNITIIYRNKPLTVNIELISKNNGGYVCRLTNTYTNAMKAGKLFSIPQNRLKNAELTYQYNESDFIPSFLK